MELNKIYNGDCLEVMKDIDDDSINLILTDPPYGTTSCAWDTVIDLDLMWLQLKRIIKPNGAIVLFGNQPFTSKLIISNIKMFKYCWVWDKIISTGFLNANKMPLKGFEDIVVFYKKLPPYNPQKTVGKPFINKRDNPNKEREEKEYLGTKPKQSSCINKGDRYPRGIIRISNRDYNPLHPTQKPVALMEYLIKTYTNENELVLDFCIGSGTTAIAAINTKRNYIGIELDKKYYDKANKRIYEHQRQIKLF